MSLRTHPEFARAEIWRPLYPFTSNYFNIADNLRMHYLDEGPRTDGKAIVMLHGNPTWSFYFRNLVKALREKHRCIVPDHIGCGFSDKPQDYPYTLAQHVENVTKLLDYLKLDEVTLLVHDWGGAIGMGAATAKPERMKRFVILNTAAFPSPRIPFRINICRIPGLGALAIRGLNGFAVAALFMAVERPLERDVQSGLLAPYNSWDNRVAHLRFVQDIPMSPTHQSWTTLRKIEESLPQFRDRPMLLCWGMKDWCFDPSFLKTWREKFPSAEVMEIPGAGHYVVEDAHAELVERISKFMAKNE